MLYTTVRAQVERKGYHLPEGRRKQVLSDRGLWRVYIRRALNTGFQFRDLINR